MNKNNVECPYCGAEREVDFDSIVGSDPHRKHVMACGDCGKDFAFTAEVSVTYTSYKTDCLNGGDHRWRFESGYPFHNSVMRCETCDESRKPTAEEFKENAWWAV